MRFTSLALQALAADPAKTVEHFDTGTGSHPGLSLRVAPTGRKTFCIHFTLAGKRARMDLGRFPDVPLADAVNRYREARAALAMDPPQDPRTVRRALAEAAEAVAVERKTVAQIIAGYLADPDVSKLKTCHKVGVTLRNQVGRHIGDVVADDLTQAQLAAIITAIRKRGKQTFAAEVHKCLRLCFRWAIGQGEMKGPNPMDNIPAPKLPTADERGEKIRPMDNAEIAAFWNGIADVLPAHSRGIYCRILKLILLTGCRVSEIAGIQPGEIRDGVLTISGNRTKNRKPHAIPLNGAMLELIGNNLDDPWGQMLGRAIDGSRVSESFSDLDLSKRLGSVKGYNVHSLRRTFATVAHGRGFSLETIGMCLNHTHKAEKGARVTMGYIAPDEETRKLQYDRQMATKRECFDAVTARILALAAG